MNVNTRAKTITPSVSEKRWLDETYSIALTVSSQSFVSKEEITACRKLMEAIAEFKGVLLDLTPKKEAKAPVAK